MALTQILGVGTMALIANASGRKDRGEANLIFNQSLLLAGVCAAATLAVARRPARFHAAPAVDPVGLHRRAAGDSEPVDADGRAPQTAAAGGGAGTDGRAGTRRGLKSRASSSDRSPGCAWPVTSPPPYSASDA
jgi:hypothetical protein